MRIEKRKKMHLKMMKNNLNKKKTVLKPKCSNNNTRRFIFNYIFLASFKI